MNLPRPCLSCGRVIQSGSRCRECEGRAYAGSVLGPSSGGWRWSAIRAAVLAREPLCRACGAPAVVVDHIVERVRGGSDDLSNLMPMCDDCHRVKHGKGRGRGVQRFSSAVAENRASGARTLAKFGSGPGVE